MEFSKRIILGSYILAVGLTMIAVIAMLFDRMVDPIVPIVLASWAEVSIANGFYYWKAKAENTIKIAKTITDEEAERISHISNIL
jgi:hypothetical protein